MKKIKRIGAVAAAVAVGSVSLLTFSACSNSTDKIVLRVCNWEEYVDLGEWDEEERIEIDNEYAEDGIFGENSMVDDFVEWFNSTHDYEVQVEYSTFGTNEDLYNRLSLGDVYDLVCPSDYMIMKLIAEGNYVDYTADFWADNEQNYYANYVSRYIDGDEGSIYNGYGWHGKAACYMWGTLGLVYNPEEVDAEDVSSWSMLLNDKYARKVTVKDNVRDAYFATLGILNDEKLKNGGLAAEELSAIMNDTDSETIAAAEDILKRIKDNVYSFETDSGKADMVTGKVVANEQWSGDAVYIMDEAEEDGAELWYSVPEECTNIWFDGWIKLKNGVEWSERRHEAAEAFVNFLARPDNAVRNMYYIGYTSAIAGQTVFDYLEYNYAADEDAEETFEYDLNYFFGDGKNYSITADASCFDIGDDNSINRGRQLFAQYPPESVIARSVVMLDFGDKLGEINQMWINVRCLDLLDISPVTVGVTCAVIGVIAIAALLYAFRYKIFIRNNPRKGYQISK